MQTFEQITLGGLDWAVWGRTPTEVYLVSVKSVISKSILKQQADDLYNSVAEFKDGEIDKFLNGKLIRHICRRKIPYNAIKAPIEIFDVDQFKRIRDMGFVFPPIPEGRWWLQSHAASDGDESVANYMLQVDNNGILHKECGVYRAGVRAVLKLDKSALNEVQRAQVEMAPVAIDKDPAANRPSTSHHIPNAFKKFHGADGLSTSDRYTKLHYYIAFCPAEESLKDETLSLEVMDASEEQQALCSLPNVLIEYLSVGKEYVYVAVEAAPDIAPEKIVANIKEHLIPKSLMEDRNFFSKLIHRVPRFWADGYMISHTDIPMSVLGEYQKTLSKTQ